MTNELSRTRRTLDSVCAVAMFVQWPCLYSGFVPSTSTTTRPPVLFLAAVVLVVEAVGAAAFGLVEIPQIRLSRLVLGLGVTLLMLGYAACLLILARAVGRSRPWARGPVVATQLLQGLLAYSFASPSTWWVAFALGATALVVLVCVLTPAATAVFAPSSSDDAR